MKHGDIIHKIQVTEKGTALAVKNQFVLEVAKQANKIEIRQAVEKQFGVHVLAVNTQNHKGETRTLRNRRTVSGSIWKTAVVTLKPGERIESV
jgi:large subunit ribosomal protein L23